MNFLKRKQFTWLLLVAVCLFTSCSTVFDDRDGCPVGCHIRFKYDYNMKWADAFANEVNRVTLYIFDSDNHYVTSLTEEGAALKTSDYYMSLQVKPGKYTLVAYGGIDGESFKATDLQTGKSTPADLQVAMTGSRETSATELHPLWHGLSRSFTVTGGYQEHLISLVKDTNTLKVMLQQVEGGEMDASKFTMTIEDDNTAFAWDNSLITQGSNTVYNPYLTGNYAVTDATGTGNIAYGQFSLSRLMADSKARLKIVNNESLTTVIDIPLVDYLLYTGMEGKPISAQEYLDRQDEYSFIFFLDPDYRWIKVQIIINGWTIRMDDMDYQ